MEFSNVGFQQNRRAFPGFPARSEKTRTMVAPRGTARFDLKVGDILSVQPDGVGQTVVLLVFGDDGRPRPDLLGTKTNESGSFSELDCAPLAGWVTANGGWMDVWTGTRIGLDEQVALKSSGNCTVWACRPAGVQEHVSGPSAGVVELAVVPGEPSGMPPLPPALGDIRDEFTVRRGTAGAYVATPGEYIQIIDIEGQQCSDFMALRLEALDAGVERTVDSTATRSMVGGAYPGPGLFDKFFDSEMKPMLQVIQDTCGRHDTFGLACTARGYEERGFPGHLNCSDNISVALEPFGVARRTTWPAINFFWNTWVDQNTHRLMTEESHSRPGDYVILKALDRLVCVSTACPDDIDPINGWNPTDVHVRIYRPEAPIRRAVAFRPKEDAPMSVSTESAFHPATSKLTSQFAPARDLWVPVTFPSVGTVGEYWACRERATLQDMSSLAKYDIVGPDAEQLLQKTLTRDVSRLSVWRGTYALMCDDTGSVVDDGTLFRLAPDLFRWCCGSEECTRVLEGIARSEGLQVRVRGLGGALPNLALQGPNSRKILGKVTFTQPTVPSLEDLKWFGVTVARIGDLDGIPFMLSRSGYTGELGYELFCSRSDAPALWDAIMEAGEEFGIAPMGSSALEILRIEAGLAAAGAEFAPGVDAFEAGLGFAVDLRKGEFRGRAALERNSGDIRKTLKGLKFDCNDVPAKGAHVLLGERPVGVITSAARSPKFGSTIAMARLAVENAENGTRLDVGLMDGRMKRLAVTVCDTPMYDPKRERARA